MGEINFPTDQCAVVDATAASSPVAAVVAAMRRIAPESGPVAADQVRAWADTLMAELYSAHVARWEYRHTDDFAPGCWAEANAEQVYYGPQRGLVIRPVRQAARAAAGKGTRVQEPHLHQVRRPRRLGRSGLRAAGAGSGSARPAPLRSALAGPAAAVAARRRPVCPEPFRPGTPVQASRLPAGKAGSPHYGVRKAMTQKQISHPEGLLNCAAGHRARHIHDLRAPAPGGGHLVECCCRSTSKKADADAAPAEMRRINRRARSPRAAPGNVVQFKLGLCEQLPQQ